MKKRISKMFRIIFMTLVFCGIAHLEQVNAQKNGDNWKTIPTNVLLRNYSFKYENYVCFWVGRNETVEIKLINDYKQGISWMTDVYFQIFDEEGDVGEYLVPPAVTETVSLTSDKGEIFAVYMNSRRTYHRIEVGERPWAFLAFKRKAGTDFISRRKQERFYFHVPATTEEIDLRFYPLKPGQHCLIVTPEDKVALDFVKLPTGLSSPHIIWKPVPDKCRGTVCSIVFPKNQKRFVLTPDPHSAGFLSPNPKHVEFLIAKSGKVWPRWIKGGAKPPPEAMTLYEDKTVKEDPEMIGTASPIIYACEYGNSDRMFNFDKFLPVITQLGNCGPHVLEMDKTAPFCTLFGDTQDIFSGKIVKPDLTVVDKGKVELGQPCESIEQVKKKAQIIKKMNENLAKAGVKWPIFYTNASHCYGNPEKRLGVFHLYDHWDEYAKVFPELGTRPEDPPEKWTRYSDSGKPERGSRSGGICPTNQFRYRPCLNNPSWRRFYAGVVAVGAKNGFNGVHIDCAGQHYCGCERCEEGFRKHLTEKYTPKQLKELFGIEKPEDIKQPPFRMGGESSLLDIERERFQLGKVTTGFWDAVREGGESVVGKGNFWIHASSEESREYCSGHNNSIMFEETDRFIGLIEREVMPKYFHNKYGSLIFEYKSDQAYSILTLKDRPRMAGAIPAKNRTFGEYSVRLGIAEGAAFGSGGGGFSTFTPGYVFDINRKFFEGNPELYEGLLPGGTVGIYQNYENRIIFYNHEEHIAANTRLCEELLKLHVPFDFVVRAASLDFIKQYKVITALDMPQIEKNELNELAEYVKSGGTLIIDDRFALDDEFLKKRRQLPWGNYLGKSGYDIKFEKGRIISLKAPEKASELVVAIEKALGYIPVVAESPPGLRINLLRKKRSGEEDVVLHLVNYNVPLIEGTNSYGKYLKEPCKPKPIGPITIRLPLPPDSKVKSVSIKSPDFEIKPEFDLKVVNGILKINLKKIFIYSVMRVIFEKRSQND